MVFILHACCTVVSVSCHFEWGVHDNMGHRSGDLSSLHWCSKGCINNQLLLTNLFDEFDFVQISFGIPARAAGPFDGIHFYKSIIVAFVKMTAKPSEARDEIPIGKVFFEVGNMFGNMVFILHAWCAVVSVFELSFCMRCACQVKVIHFHRMEIEKRYQQQAEAGFLKVRTPHFKGRQL